MEYLALLEQNLKLLETPVVQKILLLSILFLVVIFFSRFFRHLVKSNIRNKEARYKFQKIIRFLSYIVLCIVTMAIFEVKLEGVSVAFGVAGAGIAFALQEVIVSIAGYMAIMTSRFYETGDRIQLGGIRGDVVDIGILRTTLMEIGDWINGDLYNGKMVRVSNSFIFKDPVYNYSGDFPFLWDELTIPIKTTSDVKLAKSLILDMAEKQLLNYALASKKAWQKMTNDYALENARVEPTVSLAFDANWTSLTLRYIVDFKKRRSTKSELFEAILESIKASNGQVEVATASIEVETL